MFFWRALKDLKVNFQNNKAFQNNMKNDQYLKHR